MKNSKWNAEKIHSKNEIQYKLKRQLLFDVCNGKRGYEVPSGASGHHTQHRTKFRDKFDTNKNLRGFPSQGSDFRK